MSAKERKRESAKGRKRAPNALLRKNCKQPVLKQSGLGTPVLTVDRCHLLQGFTTQPLPKPRLFDSETRLNVGSRNDNGISLFLVQSCCFLGRFTAKYGREPPPPTPQNILIFALMAAFQKRKGRKHQNIVNPLFLKIHRRSIQ